MIVLRAKAIEFEVTYINLSEKPDWFLEIGLITPPVGLNCFILKGVVGDAIPLETIFKGILWFLLMDVFTLALLIAFPEISLWLPSLLFR